MQQKPLGRSGLSVPPLVLGANVFGWSVDDAQSFAILDAAAERGLTAIDTADVYSHWKPGNTGGESETIIGRWLKARGRRDDIAIHTKGGAPGAPGEFANAKLTAAYLTGAVDGSLRRLGVETIDLYYVHYDDEVTPAEETLGALGRLIAAGKIRAIGASNYQPARLAAALKASAAHGLPRFACLQTHYNLYERAAFETALEGLCVAEGLGVLPYFALASGFLSGKYRTEADFAKSAARGGRVKSMLNPRGLRILAALDAVAARLAATPAQIALAWLMARPSVTAPIASATSLAQLDDLVAATRVTLDAAAIAALGAASAPD